MDHLKQIFKETDLVFIGICGLCSGISVLALYSIYDTMSIMPSSRPVITQLGASLIGLGAAFIISFVDYRELCENYKWHSVLSYGLMILTMFIGYGPEGTTNKAWIQLPLGLSLQPSELLKISTILMLAFFLDKHKTDINEIRVLIKLALLACIPLGAVVIQKDGGTLLIYVAIIICMFFAAGVSAKLVWAGIGAAVLASPFLWFIVLEDYQRNRVLALFNPDKFASIMWQQNMGKISIGAGKIFGKGFLIDNHNAVPLAYNDFIFSFIAESVGFVGTLLLLGLILTLCFRILSISRYATDLKGSYVCVGVFAMLMAQTIINIGMNLSVLPVIGVTLPLFSAGGTSVVAVYCAIGLVLSVARHNKRKLF